jgi:transketolase
MKYSKEIKELEIICSEVRYRILKTILNAGSGHLGGCLSSVELMVALYFGGILRFDPGNPRHPNRDRVLVRGHLGPLRYSIFSLLGWVSKEELNTYRLLGSRLQGHESMELVPGVDVTPSGSLGMVLSYGVGSAFALRAQGLSSMTYVFLGDGEEQEGNVAEAARHASHLKLSNLVCIIDRNTKQLSRLTVEADSEINLKSIWQGYGWHIKEIKEGNSVPQILNTFRAETSREKPMLVIADTIKGKGLAGAEQHESGYHTISRCPREYVEKAVSLEARRLKRLLGNSRIENIIAKRIQANRRPSGLYRSVKNYSRFNIDISSSNDFDEALTDYFRNLVERLLKMKRVRFYSMTADWTPKPVVEQCGFTQQHVNYLDVGIREQHLFAMAHGISVTDDNSKILIICGDCFILRSGDQLWSIAQAGSRMVIVGTDSGICQRRNGATHQSTGQPGALISMPGLIVLEPADVVDLVNCLNWAFTKYSGPIYLRLHSGMIKRLGLSNSQRNISAYVAYKPQKKSRLIIVASGIVLDGAIAFAEKWNDLGIGIKVINVINMEALDYEFVKLMEENIPVIAVYNGNPFVLHSAVAKAVSEHSTPRPSIIKSHGFTSGTTGSLKDLLKHFQLDAEGIEKVVKLKFPGLLH